MSVSQFLGDEMTQPFEVLIIQLNIIMTSTLKKKRNCEKNRQNKRKYSQNPELRNESSSNRWSRLCVTKNGKNIVAFSLHKRSSGLGVKQVHCINHLGAEQHF